MTVASLQERIALIQPTLQGWCSLEKAVALASMVTALQPRTVVEIGVFGGSSLIPMALALQDNHIRARQRAFEHKTRPVPGPHAVIGIDPWEKEASLAGESERQVEWWANLDHEAIYNGFAKRVRELHLTDYVTIIRKRSDDVTPPEHIDIFHCDGNHTDQATRDIERFSANVRTGGLVVLDDIGWSGGGVDRGVELLLRSGFVHLYDLGTGAVFQRVG